MTLQKINFHVFRYHINLNSQTITTMIKKEKEIVWFTYINNEKVIVDAIGNSENSYNENFEYIGKHLVISETAKGYSYPVHCFKWK